MFKDNKVIISAVLAVVLLVVSYQVGFSLGKKKTLDQNNKEIAKLNKALDFFVPQPLAEVFYVSGEIKSISGNVISLEINSPSERNLPGMEPKKEIRKIDVASGTKLFKISLFAVPGIDPKTKLPAPPKEETIKISDLKVGNIINVSSKENIKDKTEFEASGIQLQVLP